MEIKKGELLKALKNYKEVEKIVKDLYTLDKVKEYFSEYEGYSCYDDECDLYETGDDAHISFDYGNISVSFSWYYENEDGEDIEVLKSVNDKFLLIINDDVNNLLDFKRYTVESLFNELEEIRNKEESVKYKNYNRR